MTHPHALADSADRIGTRYLEIAERAGVRGFDPYISAGGYCAKCGPSFARLNASGETCCSTCDRPWDSRKPGDSAVGRSLWLLRGAGARRSANRNLSARPSSRAEYDPHRNDASERRLVTHVDAIRSVQSLVETVPPGLTADDWHEAALAWLAFLHPKLGSEAAVWLWAHEYRPRYAAAWGHPDDVRREIAAARAWVGLRLARKRWQREESMAARMRGDDWMTPAEAAVALGIATRTVYTWIDDKILVAQNVGRRGAKRPTLLVSRESVDAELERRKPYDPGSCAPSAECA